MDIRCVPNNFESVVFRHDDIHMKNRKEHNKLGLSWAKLSTKLAN